MVSNVESRAIRNGDCEHCKECAKRERMALSREQMALKLLHDALLREKHLVDAMNKTVRDLKTKIGNSSSSDNEQEDRV